jgi:hypothetical protein
MNKFSIGQSVASKLVEDGSVMTIWAIVKKANDNAICYGVIYSDGSRSDDDFWEEGELEDATPKPLFMVGDRVTILASSDVGTVNQVLPNGAYWVATSEISRGLSFHESELALKYRPSWNKS